MTEEANVNIVSGRQEGELGLHVEMNGFQIFADGRTRFGGGGPCRDTSGGEVAIQSSR